MAAAGPSLSLQDFLQPLSIDLSKVVALAASLSKAYRRLAAESQNQFLPTPVSDSTLCPSAAEPGRYGMFSFSVLVIFIEYMIIKEIFQGSSRFLHFRRMFL
jgi:hypothetical protein